MQHEEFSQFYSHVESLVAITSSGINKRARRPEGLTGMVEAVCRRSTCHTFVFL